jgi:hypothetical protein
MPFATVRWNDFFTSMLRPACHVTWISTMRGGYENAGTPLFRIDAVLLPDGNESGVWFAPSWIAIRVNPFETVRQSTYSSYIPTCFRRGAFCLGASAGLSAVQ